MKVKVILLISIIAMIMGCDKAQCPSDTIEMGGRCVKNEICDGTGTPNINCLQCEQNSHCTELNASQCNPATYLCEGCEEDSDCQHLSDTPVCHTSYNQCFECVENDDCEGSDNGPICDTDSNTCISCTADNEEDVCGDDACRLSDGDCTNVERGSLSPCEECEADSQCQDGTKCVPYLFGGQFIEYVCLWVAPNGECAEVGNPSTESLQPFTTPATLTSIDGESDFYCKLSAGATCESLKTFNDLCSTDDNCGASSLEDGVCADIEGNDLCTYECSEDLDCPVTQTCDVYCQ